MPKSAAGEGRPGRILVHVTRDRLWERLHNICGIAAEQRARVVLCYALARTPWYVRGVRRRDLWGDAIENDRGRGGAGRAASVGGRRDPGASHQTLQGFRGLGFPVW